MSFFRKPRVRKVCALLLALTLVITYYCACVAAVDVVKGDFDTDGKVSAGDARMILRVAARLEKITDPEMLFRIDVDNNRVVNSADARIALRTAARMVAPIVVSSAPPTTNGGNSQTLPSDPSEVTTTERPLVANTTSIFTPIDDIGIEKPPYPAIPDYEIKPDSFVFICYGYGHGVGLSQYGAIAMARHGFSYAQILAHYFQGISIVTESIPCAVSTLHTGEQVDTMELLYRTVQQEIAGITKSTDIEALKAQAVAAYTLLKSHNYKLPNRYTMAYSSSMASVRSDVIAAVNAVAGSYLTYNGNLITAPFFAYSAGITTDASTVWGGNYPYLKPVSSYYDIEVEKYAGYRSLITTAVFTAQEMSRYIKNYDSSIQLSDDHSQWLQVLAHDCAVSSEIGYVSAMRIGDRVIDQCAGQKLRMNIMDLAIDSHCFALVYYDQNLQMHSCNAVTYGR